MVFKETDSTNEKCPCFKNDSEVLIYSRNELISMRDSLPIEFFREIASRKWKNIKEPFELDDEMRVPLPQQLKVIRKREKLQRVLQKKVSYPIFMKLD